MFLSRLGWAKASWKRSSSAATAAAGGADGGAGAAANGAHSSAAATVSSQDGRRAIFKPVVWNASTASCQRKA
jgi:hypothetical protein